MNAVTIAFADPESHPWGRSTTIRLTIADLKLLAGIRASTSLTRNSVVGLAVAAMHDHVSRTGKLPCPYAPKSSTRKEICGIA